MTEAPECLEKAVVHSIACFLLSWGFVTIYCNTLYSLSSPPFYSSVFNEHPAKYRAFENSGTGTRFYDVYDFGMFWIVTRYYIGLSDLILEDMSTFLVSVFFWDLFKKALIKSSF